MQYITTFPRMQEFEKMRDALASLGLRFDVIDPSPGFSQVGCPAIALEQEARAALASAHAGDFITSGWVGYQTPVIQVPHSQPQVFAEDVFGNSSVMVLAPCIADEKKIRLIAHTTKDMSVAFPYLNAIMKEGAYNHENKIFTFMEGYRMITLYPQRISIAKLDDVVDGWRVLEKIRYRLNEVYSRRASIEPSYEMRKKPPALEIYKRLPGTNCGACGQKTCMAFAMALWSGNAKPSQCIPLFHGDYKHLKVAFLEICSGIATDSSELIFEET